MPRCIILPPQLNTIHDSVYNFCIHAKSKSTDRKNGKIADDKKLSSQFENEISHENKYITK